MEKLDTPQTNCLCHDLSAFLLDVWNWRRHSLATMRMLNDWRDELLAEECPA